MGEGVKKMNNQDRKPEAIRQLQSLRNVGRITAERLYSIGIKTPQEMKRSDPKILYNKLRKKMGGRLDKCVLYQFQGAILDIHWWECKNLNRENKQKRR